MDNASLVTIGALVFMTLWWVLRPLWSREQQFAEETLSPTQQMVEELTHRRDALYTAIKDLEQDFASGKVSEIDHAQLRGRLTQDAASVLKEIDTITSQTEANLEHEIDNLFTQYQRANKTKPADQAMLKRAQEQIKLVVNSKKTDDRHCLNCQSTVQPDDVFCSQCGTTLNKQCPQCQQAVLPTDRFCAQCGFALRGEAIQ